jgi:MFS family permease
LPSLRELTELRLSPGLPPLFISSFTFNLGAAMALLTVTLHAIELGATPLELGVIGTIWPAVFSVSAIFAGSMSDRMPRKTLPVLGSAIACLTFPVVALASSPLHIMILGIPAGISLSFVWPPIEAWVADLSSAADMRRDIGIFNLSWSIGAAPGPVIAGLAFKGGVAVPLAMGVALIAFAGLLVLLKGREPDGEDAGGIMSEESPEFARRFLHLAWIVNFATYFTIGVMRSLFPKLGQELGFGTPSIGALLSLVTVSQVVTFAVLARTSRWHYNVLPLLASQVSLLLASLLVFSVSGVLALAPVMILIGACTGLSYYSSIYYSLATPAGKGARSGIHEALIGTGLVAGPLTGGVAAQNWGLRTPYLLSALVVMVGATATAAFGLRFRRMKRAGRDKG